MVVSSTVWGHKKKMPYRPQYVNKSQGQLRNQNWRSGDHILGRNGLNAQPNTGVPNLAKPCMLI